VTIRYIVRMIMMERFSEVLFVQRHPGTLLDVRGI
jgi:hypothetical protein